MGRNELAQFARRIRSLRIKTGLSQEALGDLAGLHRTYIGGIERGERNVGILNILRLARALRVSPSKLFEKIE